MSGREPNQAPHASLRQQAFRSGRHLVARQVIGMAMRIGGVVLVTSIIGPSEYGLFAGPAGIMGVLSAIAMFGLDVHLIRSDPSRSSEDTAFTLLVVSSVAVALVAVASAPAFGALLDDNDVVAPMRVMAAMLPVAVLWAPARARLERTLAFRTLAGIELASDALVYLVTVPLALAGWGVWSLVAGFGARHLLLLVGVHVMTRYRPRLSISATDAREAIRFGAGYSAGSWVSIAGDLVNPLVVGALLGPVGVGQVSLAARLIEALGAVKQATMRLATAALARLTSDVERLRRAHAEGMLVQVLGAVPVYSGAAFLAPWILPLIYGDEWKPVPKLIALLAAAAAAGTIFNLHATTLNVLGRNGPVARLRLLQLALQVSASLAAIPSFGAAGFGIGRLARTVPFALVHRDLCRVFRPNYGRSVTWVLAFLVPMASPWVAPTLRPLLLLAPLAMAASAHNRADVRRLAVSIRS